MVVCLVFGFKGFIYCMMGLVLMFWFEWVIFMGIGDWCGGVCEVCFVWKFLGFVVFVLLDVMGVGWVELVGVDGEGIVLSVLDFEGDFVGVLWFCVLVGDGVFVFFEELFECLLSVLIIDLCGNVGGEIEVVDWLV